MLKMQQIMENYRQAEQITLPPAEQRQIDLLQQVENLLVQIRSMLDEEELEEKRIKKVKNAVPGNPWRKPAGTEGAGQFTDKDKAGSFSLWFASKGKKGKGGRAQVKGGREMFTKADDCGRKTADGRKKNTYKCSKPKEKYD